MFTNSSNQQFSIAIRCNRKGRYTEVVQNAKTVEKQFPGTGNRHNFPQAACSTCTKHTQLHQIKSSLHQQKIPFHLGSM